MTKKEQHLERLSSAKDVKLAPQLAVQKALKLVSNLSDQDAVFDAEIESEEVALNAPVAEPTEAIESAMWLVSQNTSVAGDVFSASGLTPNSVEPATTAAKPLVSSSGLPVWAYVGLGAGALALGSGAKSSSPQVSEKTPPLAGVKVVGTVTLGTAIEGLVVKLVDEDGKTVATTETDTAGTYAVEVGAEQRGKILTAVVLDPVVDGKGYTDEATGSSKDIAGVVRAKFLLPTEGLDLRVQVTPLTEVAVRQMTKQTLALTAESVKSSNDAVSKLFGVQDIVHTEPPVVVQGQNKGDAYGKALALLSGMDESYAKAGIANGFEATLSSLDSAIKIENKSAKFQATEQSMRVLEVLSKSANHFDAAEKDAIIFNLLGQTSNKSEGKAPINVLITADPAELSQQSFTVTLRFSQPISTLDPDAFLSQIEVKGGNLASFGPVNGSTTLYRGTFNKDGSAAPLISWKNTINNTDFFGNQLSIEPAKSVHIDAPAPVSSFPVVTQSSVASPSSSGQSSGSTNLPSVGTTFKLVSSASDQAERIYWVTVRWGDDESKVTFKDADGRVLRSISRAGNQATSAVMFDLSDSAYQSRTSEKLYAEVTVGGAVISLPKPVFELNLQDFYQFGFSAFRDANKVLIKDGLTNTDTISIEGVANANAQGKSVSVWIDNNKIGTTTVANGKWALQTDFVKGLRDGVHQVAARIDEKNPSLMVTKNSTISLDKTAPEVSLAPHGLALDGNRLEFTLGTTSNASRVNLYGKTAADAAKVEVYLDGVLKGLATVKGLDWSYELSQVAPKLSNIEVKAYDALGNSSSVASTLNQVPATQAQTWSRQDGWGAVDLVKAYEELTGNRVTPNVEPVQNATSIVKPVDVGHVQALHDQGIKGKGITIAILDSGIRDEYFPSTSISPKSYNFVNKNFDVRDDFGHGTRQASIMVGGRLADGTLVKGVAPEAELLVLKVASSFVDVNETNFAQAIRYAVDNGADIISIALSADKLDDPTRWAIQHAKEHDVLIVASGGNDAGTPFWFPAGYGGLFDSVIGVGGYKFNANGQAVLDDVNIPASNFSFNALVDVSEHLQLIDINGKLGQGSGASVATAMVAAKAALLDSVYPSDSYLDITRALTVGATHVSPTVI